MPNSLETVIECGRWSDGGSYMCGLLVEWDCTYVVAGGRSEDADASKGIEALPLCMCAYPRAKLRFTK